MLRLSARGRLFAGVGFLAVCLVVFGIWRPIGLDELRAAVDGLGWGAPVGYVLLAAVLACLMVPGTLLAIGAGLLFGVPGGTAVALCSSLCSAELALLLGRHIGREGLREIGGRWFDRIDALLTRRGAWAVIAQRFIPGLPDGPANYIFGAGGVTMPQMAAGTLVGSLPRAFAYATLGSAAGELDPVLAAIGTGVLILAGLVGAAIAGRAAWPHIQRRRRAAAAAAAAEQPSGRVGSGS
ncbi:MAG: hypothetical protein QOG62_880 [Thermoleophilaceae bacterium]|jgi:uncharacterized membrane protein YdjX (TVP38/TMEM64 family)|nr:hypothetical protein [Thermoleophilaceae bacterium]